MRRWTLSRVAKKGHLDNEPGARISEPFVVVLDHFIIVITSCTDGVFTVDERGIVNRALKELAWGFCPTFVRTVAALSHGARVGRSTANEHGTVV